MLRRLAIIGRGIAALSLADLASAAGMAVTIFGPPRGNGDASFVAHGFSIHKGLRLPESEFFRAKMLGQELLWQWLDAIEKESGTALRRIRGLVEPYWGIDDFHKIQSRVYRRSFTGCFRVQHRKHVPADDSIFAQEPRGELFYPADFWFDPRQALALSEEILRRRGVIFVEAPVPRLQQAGGQWLLSAAPYPSVVLATGAGTRALLEASGIVAPLLKDMPGAVLEISTHKSLPLLGLTRFGAGALIGAQSRLPVPDMAVSERLAAAKSHFHLAEDLWVAPEVHELSGIRVRSKDRLPLVGPFGAPGLFLFTALNRNGMELAPGSARSLLQMLCGQSLRRDDPVRAFAPARFNLTSPQ